MKTFKVTDNMTVEAQIICIQKTCEQCGKKFEITPSQAREGRGRFCSKKCYGKTRRKRVRKNCETCGKEFMIKLSVAKRGLGRFCSRTCHHQWMSENQSRENSANWKRLMCICEQCGKKFKVKPSKIKHGRGRFCSRACHGQWRSKNDRGEKNYNWKGGNITRTCEQCKKEFEVKPHVIRDGMGKFCSRTCHGQWISENQPYSKEISMTIKAAWAQGVYDTEETRRKMSETTKAAWERGVYANEEIRRKQSKVMKSRWEQGDMDGIFQSPTSIELEITAALDICGIEHISQYRPNGCSWIYDEFVLPDILIEIHGDYWHSLPERKRRDIEKAEWAKKNGYYLMVIWEHEIKEYGAMVLITERLLYERDDGVSFFPGDLWLE